MLVIMHDGYLQQFFQFCFDVKTLGSFNIFQIDATKSGFERFYNLYKFFRVGFIDFNIKNINICKYFKKNTLTFHHRFASLGPDIPQSQHSSTIADNRYKVAFGSIFIHIFRISCYG